MDKVGGDVSRQEALAILNGIIEMFNAYGRGHETPNDAYVLEYFDPKITFESNGVLQGKGVADLSKRWQKAIGLYSKFSISGLTKGPVTDGNQVAFGYNVDFTNARGLQGQIQIMGIATIEAGRLISWSQVAHEKGSGSWDA